MLISKTLRDAWWTSRLEDHDRRAYLRVGQDFFNAFNCQKVTGAARPMLDRLHALDGNEALILIASFTDHDQ